MLKARTELDKDGVPELVISVKGKDVMRVCIFPDESHPGVHLFLIPLSDAIICESPTSCTKTMKLEWSHELLTP